MKIVSRLVSFVSVVPLVLSVGLYIAPQTALAVSLPLGCPGVYSDYNVVVDLVGPITGTAVKDLIIVGDNNTRNINAFAGDDCISIGNLNTGNVQGGAGNDTIIIGNGNALNTVQGSGGNDTIIIGNTNSGHITGESDNDTITIGNGNVGTIDGGNGSDTITVGDSNTGNVNGGNGADTITTGEGNDVIDGGNGVDTCSGGEGTNTITNCETLVPYIGESSPVFIDTDKDHVFDGGEPTFPTIQAAVDAASNTDWIQVIPGTYSEHVAVNKEVRISGANWGVAGNASRTLESIVDGTDTDAPFAITANNVTIDGFTVRNGSNPDPLALSLFSGIWSQTGTQNSTIENNIITQNGIGVWAQCGGDCLIQTNLFDGNNKPGPSGGAAISADSTNGLTINNNEFKNHTENNPILFQAAGAGAHENLVVSNNSIHDNGCGCSAIYVLGVDVGAFTSNNITADTADIRLGSGNSSITITQNILHSTVGVNVVDDGYGFGSNTGIVINRNSITDHSNSGVDNSSDGQSPLVDATCNWWGAANGPSGEGTGSGDSVSDNVTFTPWLTTSNLDGDCNGTPGGQSTVKVVINKFIDGVQATTGNANSAAFPMVSSWVTTNFPSGSGSYPLDPAGFNSDGIPYEAHTSDMNSGASYTTNEVTTGNQVVGNSCQDGTPFALVGYTTGDSFLEASGATPTTTIPDFTDITTDKYVIVWNHDCANNAHIVVRKVTIPDNWQGSFSFNLTDYPSFGLVNGGEHTTDVTPGNYTITETVPFGWTATSSCEYDRQETGTPVTDGEEVSLEAGDTVTCTFINTQIQNPHECPQGQHWDGEECVQDPNQCVSPLTLGDEDTETVLPGSEVPLQSILDSHASGLDVMTDQKQYQAWGMGSHPFSFDIDVLANYAGLPAVFGYYTDGDLSTFTPIFKTGPVSGYEATPLMTTGTVPVTVSAGNTLEFAIIHEGGQTFATRNSLNQDGLDQVVAYDHNNHFIIAFEDLVASGGDHDYNDVVVDFIPHCQQLSCMLVSDTSNTVEGDGNAVATWVHPGWTASIPDATWIWSSAEVVDPTATTTETFLKDFSLTGAVASASLQIATDNTYTAYVNGTQVAQDLTPDNFSSADGPFDITSNLVIGNNELKFVVTNQALEGGEPHTNPAGLLYKVLIDGAMCGPVNPDQGCITQVGGCDQPDTQGHLVVIKHVINDDEIQGELEANDFQLHVTNGGATTTFQGDAVGTALNLTPGAYNVTEEPYDNYDASFSEDCFGTIAAGDHKTCTVTNDDIEFITTSGHENTVELCTDRLDNDSDGLIDSADPDCTPILSIPPDPGAGGLSNPDNGGGGGGGGGGGQVNGTSTESTTGGEVAGAADEHICTPYLDPNNPIRNGRNADPIEITKLQAFLKTHGYPDLIINGIYDSATRHAVGSFQVAHAFDILLPWGLHAPFFGTEHVWRSTTWYINFVMDPDCANPPLDLSTLIPFIL